MVNKSLSIFFVLGIVSTLNSICTLKADDRKVMSFQSYMDIVKNHHPVVYQATYLPETGDMAIRAARGAFDPVLMAQYDAKQFQNTPYYSILESGLVIPTRAGIKLHGGYEQMDGTYLNPENNVPPDGLVYAGVTLPIGRDLLIDRRRLELQKAKIFAQAQLWEQELQLNELFLDAGTAYWEWYVAYHIMKIYEEAYKLADERRRFVIRSFELGDLPAIDTTEASIQVQNLEVNLRESQISFYNAGFFLETYLWIDGNIHLGLDSLSIPEEQAQFTNLPIDPNLKMLQASMLRKHPQMEQMRLELQKLNVDIRFLKNRLLPQMDLKYNILNEQIGINPLAGANPNNFKFGVKFSMPVLLRRERGELRQTTIISKQVALDSSLLFATLQYHSNAKMNEWENTYELTETYRNVVANHLVMLEGERAKFEAGESSIFMVNTREVAYINAQIKWISLQFQNQRAALQTYFALGTRIE